MMLQTDLVLTYLLDYGSITPKEAEAHFGIMRLAAVIYKLKQDGAKIRTEKASGKNIFGKKVYFAKYVLVRGNADE